MAQELLKWPKTSMVAGIGTLLNEIRVQACVYCDNKYLHESTEARKNPVANVGVANNNRCSDPKAAFVRYTNTIL